MIPSSKPARGTHDPTQVEGAQTVPQALGRLRVALDDAYLRASRRHRLTPQQAELLCAALRPAPVGSLARELRCDQSNVTRLVDRASDRGLIRRRTDREDGRVTIIELSAKGRKKAEAFIATLEAQLTGLLANWPEDRKYEVAVTLNEISTALDQSRNAPTASNPA
jgi:DNA-binding MarR family transcriptional regulator